MRMAQGDKRWPVFTRPVIPARITVVDVREDDLRHWMADVWGSWAHEQDRVRSLVERAIPTGQ